MKCNQYLINRSNCGLMSLSIKPAAQPKNRQSTIYLSETLCVIDNLKNIFSRLLHQCKFTATCNLLPGKE